MRRDLMHEHFGKPSSIAEKLRWGELFNNQSYRTTYLSDLQPSDKPKQISISISGVKSRLLEFNG